MQQDNLDPADLPNGWTAETLDAYRAQREAAHRLVGGNTITEFKRPKPQKHLLGAKQFNPHHWN